MANNKEDSTYTHKRHHINQQTRPPGRVYQHLGGVRDLREIIDRKRNEREQCLEPNTSPDHSNHVKDPLRRNIEESPKHATTRKPPNNKNSHDNLKKDKEHVRASSSHPKPKDIENPLNIKVEFSTSTGEHVYKLDEDTVLPPIKHVPDHISSQNRVFRGRGRGRGRGQRNYQSRTIRSSRKVANDNTTYSNHGTPEVTISCEENWDDDIEKANVTNEQEEIHNEGEVHGLGEQVQNLSLTEEGSNE